MFRSVLLLLAVLLLHEAARAQTFSLSVQNPSPYTELTGGTLLTNNFPWYGREYPIPIGFPVQFGGKTYTTTLVGTDGYLRFTSSTTDFYLIAHAAAMRSRSNGASPITYQVTGQPGSRILQVQWKNAGFVSGPNTNYISFQLWLFEGSNAWHALYGPNQVTVQMTTYNGNSGPMVGTITQQDTVRKTFSGQLVTGSPGNAQLQDFNQSSTLSAVYLYGPASSDLRYVFTPTNVAAPEERPTSALAACPNPATDRFRLHGLRGTAAVQVFDATGRQVYAGTVTGEDAPLETAGLRPGLYVVQVQQNGQRQLLKLMKQ